MCFSTSVPISPIFFYETEFMGGKQDVGEVSRDFAKSSNSLN